MTRTSRTPALLAALLAAASLAACDRPDDGQTVGQRVDQTIAKTDRATDRAADRAGTQVSDATITTKVNMALAADDRLKAIKIDVDTDNGRVALKGTAPDAASRDRATTLAAAVEGVHSVDNRLTVEKH